MTLFEGIVAAHGAIRPEVPVTPLDRSAELSGAFGCEGASGTLYLDRIRSAPQGTGWSGQPGACSDPLDAGVPHEWAATG